EIPLIQRFILFLGHPIYALSVILFSLLVFGGIGASLTARWVPERAARAAAAAAGILVVLLLFYILPLPALLARLIGLEPAARVAVAAGLLLPIGLVMGMPFPLGLKIANVRSAEIIPWLWAANGATSVLASVLAIAIAITSGFSAVMFIALGMYALAALIAVGLAR
ncbi:MAG: SAM-dependent methyltransferase, partial [Armatimonadota bacterium]